MDNTAAGITKLIDWLESLHGETGAHTVFQIILNVRRRAEDELIDE